jgi:hypothetical protein
VSATLSGFACAGHGSIAGSTVVSDPFSTVVLSKGGVNLAQSGVAPFVAGSNQTSNAFSFCVPGSDTYTLQHFEAAPNSTPVPVTGGGPVTAQVPAPIATSSPGCETICNQSSGQCLLCLGTTLVNPIQ